MLKIYFIANKYKTEENINFVTKIKPQLKQMNRVSIIYN